MQIFKGVTSWSVSVQLSVVSDQIQNLELRTPHSELGTHSLAHFTLSTRR